MKSAKILNLRRARKSRARQIKRDGAEVAQPISKVEKARQALENRRLDAHRKDDDG
ncbi:MAG: DUF4169 domain-containing protein [Pseudomonadota bacterium]